MPRFVVAALLPQLEAASSAGSEPPAVPGYICPSSQDIETAERRNQPYITLIWIRHIGNIPTLIHRIYAVSVRTASTIWSASIRAPVLSILALVRILTIGGI